jgi:hypothetical protein
VASAAAPAVTTRRRATPGGCFACKGRGHHVTTAGGHRPARAREAKREAEAATFRAAAGAVNAILLAIWGDEFAHVDPEWRHTHLQQKAFRILYEHGINTRYVADIVEHYGLLGLRVSVVQGRLELGA